MVPGRRVRWTDLGASCGPSHDAGEYLLWDDTFIHEMLNRSGRVRTVLLLGVWRPGMPMDMEVFSRLIAFGVRLGVRSRRLARLCEMTNTVAGAPFSHSTMARGSARASSTIMPRSWTARSQAR